MPRDDGANLRRPAAGSGSLGLARILIRIVRLRNVVAGVCGLLLFQPSS